MRAEYEELELLVIEAAVSIVRRKAYVDRTAQKLDRDSRSTTFEVVEAPQNSAQLSREEGLEQMMEWCGHELAALRAAPPAEPRKLPPPGLPIDIARVREEFGPSHDSGESLARFYTFAFGLETMQEYIRRDPTGTRGIDGAVWFAIVPEVYRNDVQVLVAAASSRHRGRRLTDSAVYEVVVDLHRMIWGELTPIPPASSATW